MIPELDYLFYNPPNNNRDSWKLWNLEFKNKVMISNYYSRIRIVINTTYSSNLGYIRIIIKKR